MAASKEGTGEATRDSINTSPKQKTNITSPNTNNKLVRLSLADS
jgi:hypothetical protein